MVKTNVKVVATTYAGIMLCFGCLFVLFSATFENWSAIATLSQAGWVLIALSVPLFIVEAAFRKGKHH